MDKNLQRVPSNALKEVYSEALPLNFEYLSKTRGKKTRLDWVRRAYWKAGYDFTYKTQYTNYVHGAPWKMPCTAGQTSIVIDYNGDVRVCELRKPIDNLRKHGMDFRKFWESLERRREVQSVKADKCFCTHICFMYDSMRHSKRVMLWELPLLYTERLLQNLFSNKPLKQPKTIRPDETLAPVIMKARLPQPDTE
jgi:MoaA/NifB/PqqE/SkfB family radical SAM enzyme